MKKLLISMLALLPVLLLGQIGIYFTFDNGQITGSGEDLYYEYDVMVYGDNGNTRFSELLVLINYNSTAFGTAVNFNGNVTVTPGDVFAGSPFYAVRWNDNQPTRLAIGCEFLLEIESYAVYLPANPVSLFHVKFAIQDANASAGLFFSETTMAGEQFYADHFTQYNPVTASDTLDETLPVELTSFTAIANNSFTGVNLTWVTQSESNLVGYGIFRGDSDVFNQACDLNAFINATNTSQTQLYMYHDTDLEPEHTYWYWLESKEMNGENQYFGPITFTMPATQIQAPEIPVLTDLVALFPNPFNPSLNIGYTLGKNTRVNIVVINLKGQVVKHLLDDNRAAGMHSCAWDGRDDLGNQCASGMYIIKMEADGIRSFRKAMLLK
jgi:hypothetical protein